MGRTDVRNDTREGPLATCLGTIEPTVPRHRNVPFRTLVFNDYGRSEAALVATMAEMVLPSMKNRSMGVQFTQSRHRRLPNGASSRLRFTAPSYTRWERS